MEIYLVQPRGFCAGVRRALDIVNKALAQKGKPIYVRHEIVHNKHIIEDLKKRGVVFVNELDEIEDKTRPVILSAHGTAVSVLQQAECQKLHVIDAICPLVETVHKQIQKLAKENAEIIVIGKATHPEIIGTIGQIDNTTKVYIIATLEDAENLMIPEENKIGIVTQTTLSVDETEEIVSCLRKRFKNIINFNQVNICFATTNRQNAVRQLVQKTPNIIIIGSKNSSNSTHLKEAALRYGAKRAWLIDDASEVDWMTLDQCQSVGISAGASAPEYLVEQLISFLKQRYNNINVHNVIIAEEDISFK